MMPVRRTQSWLPSIFNDFFDNDWMVKANATAPAINVFETEKEYKVELAAPRFIPRGENNNKNSSFPTNKDKSCFLYNQILNY